MCTEDEDVKEMKIPMSAEFLKKTAWVSTAVIVANAVGIGHDMQINHREDLSLAPMQRYELPDEAPSPRPSFPENSRVTTAPVVSSTSNPVTVTEIANWLRGSIRS